MSASFFGRRFIVPAFPAPPLPFAVLPSGLAGVDYSVRRFPDSSVPGCCPSRCRFPYRFRYRCSGASPALPMPSRMSCALGTWLLLPGCDPACLSVLWVPGAGCPPLACLLSGYRMPAACRGFSLVPGGAFSAPASFGLRGNTMSFSPAPQPLRAVIPFSSSRRPCRLPSRSP